MQHHWEDRQRTTLRWFMAFAGLGLLIPGVIYLLSWPDTVKAFSLAFGSEWAVWASGLSVIPLIFGGGTFLLARYLRHRYVRIGAVMAMVSLLLGSLVHYQWSNMMIDRLGMMPAGISEAERVMLEDTILFAANAQVPHIMKNLVLVGVCVMFYVLAPRLCRDVGV